MTGTMTDAIPYAKPAAAPMAIPYAMSAMRPTLLGRAHQNHALSGLKVHPFGERRTLMNH